MEIIWQTLAGAPWWVYVLFAYLLSIGVRSLRPRTIPIKRIILLPLFFVCWSFYGLYEKIEFRFPLTIIAWVFFIAIGAFLGAKEVRNWPIEKDRSKGLITIPGNYSTLVLILLIFALKFFWGYFYATQKLIPFWIYRADIISSAFVSGFFVGRSSIFFKRYHNL